MLAKMTLAGCPDENVLVRFSTGQLSGVDLGALEQHLDGCGSCRALVAQLTSAGPGRETGAPGSAPGLAGDPRALSPNDQIGRYRVERLVGGGGMGVVYAARDRELNRTVAIKLLRTQAAQPELRARLLREAQTMASLSHPNLVPIFELGQSGADDFLAMELVDGPTLDLWLREQQRDWKLIVQVFIEAGRGLEAAHKAGIVHRDFKPGNVLIGPGGRARVSDFGLSRPDARATRAEGAEEGPVGLTRAGTLLGTPAYMSPEQLEGQVADVRSDQFSFCVALVEALTGKRPFAGKTVEELRTTMRARIPLELAIEPSRLKRALLKGLARDPDQRFASIGEFLNELEGVVAAPAARREWSSKERTAVVGVGLAVILGGAFGWSSFGRSSSAPAPVVLQEVTEGELTLSIGERRALIIPGLKRVSSVDATVADAILIEGEKLYVTGNREGVTQVLVWAGEKRITFPVRVAAAEAQKIEATTGEPLTVGLGEELLLTVPGLQRLAVGDVSIATVKAVGTDQVQVLGHGGGTTTLLVWTRSGTRISYQVTVTVPVPGPVATPAGPTPMDLFVGQERVLDIPGMQRIAVGDSDIADVKTIGNNQLLLIGAGAGKTTLLVWTPEKRLEYELTVSAPEASAPDAQGQIEFSPGQLKVVKLKGVTRVAVGDPEIADAKLVGGDEVLITAAHEGTTTVMLWAGEKRRAYLAHVRRRH